MISLKSNGNVGLSIRLNNEHVSETEPPELLQYILFASKTHTTLPPPFLPCYIEVLVGGISFNNITSMGRNIASIIKIFLVIFNQMYSH